MEDGLDCSPKLIVGYNFVAVRGGGVLSSPARFRITVQFRSECGIFLISDLIFLMITTTYII